VLFSFLYYNNCLFIYVSLLTKRDATQSESNLAVLWNLVSVTRYISIRAIAPRTDPFRVSRQFVSFTRCSTELQFACSESRESLYLYDSLSDGFREKSLTPSVIKFSGFSCCSGHVASAMDLVRIKRHSHTGLWTFDANRTNLLFAILYNSVAMQI
jgi:hypothetical protein